MAVNNFLNAFLKPALKRSAQRTIRLTWLMLTLFATSGALFVLFKYPSVKENLSKWAGRLANVVFPLIHENETLAFLAPFVSWLPAIVMCIVVLLVTRALARPVGSLFFSQPPISAEFAAYSNRRVHEDANKLKGKLPELVDYVRYCFFAVWNKDDASQSGVPSEFSHEDVETALLQQAPVQTVADKIDFLTTAASKNANKSVHRLTERWLGLRVKQGFQTLIVWILVLSVLLSSLPRPVLVASVSAASKANVEAMIRSHPEVRVPESQESPEDRMPALLKSELTKEDDSTDGPTNAPNAAAESTPLDEDDFDEFFSGQEEDLTAFTSIAPSLSDAIEEVEEGSGQSLGSLIFRPLDEQDEEELKEGLRKGEKLMRRVASGDVSEAEGSEIISKAKDDMVRAEELRREATKEAAEARALEAEAEQDRKDAERAQAEASKLEQDARYLESTSDALEREASRAEREAVELDPTASAEKLESEADALATARTKMQSDLERNSEEADKLEREAKADRQEAKRLEDNATSPNSEEKRQSDERRDSAKKKDELARKKREESEELKRKIDTNNEDAEKKRKKAADIKKRAEEEPSLAEDRLKADQRRLEAERKMKQAQDLRDQAAKRKEEAEQKKQEADKKNQKADGQKQKAEDKQESSKKKKRDAWKLARKAGIALAAMAIHPVLGLAAVYLMLSGKDSGSGGGSGGGSGDGEGKGDKDGPEGSESGTEGSEAGNTGSESGNAGSESGNAGSEAGNTGSESGNTGSEAGKTSGESGNAGVKSGTKGGESGAEGDASGQQVQVPSLASEGDDITWKTTGDGALIAQSGSSSSKHTVGKILKEFTDESLKSVLFQDGETAASRYLVAETGKRLYKFNPSGDASLIEHVALDDLLDEAGANLSRGGRILLELLTESGDFQLVHSNEFTLSDSKVVKAWFLYQADKERLHWILEPSEIDKRELDVLDENLKKTLADQSSPKDISVDLANALDYIATRSEQLPASNLHRYIPLFKSTIDGFRVLVSIPEGGGEKQSISVFDPKAKSASIRGVLSRLAWATLLPPAGKPLESRAEHVFFGDPIDDDFVLHEQPADWYAKGWSIVAVQLNAKESFSVVLRRESTANEVLLRYLPPTGQADRKWLEANLSDMSARYTDRRKSVPSDYAGGRHSSVTFDVPVDVRIFDSWVFQGMPTSYPAWGRSDKAEVFWLFDRD